MGVDTKVGGRAADAGKEQHNGPGSGARQAERSQGHGPAAGDVFKKHKSDNTNDNCDCIPVLGGK